MKLKFWDVNEIEVRRRVKVIKKEMKAGFEKDIQEYKNMLYRQQIIAIDSVYSSGQQHTSFSEDIIEEIRKEKSQLIDRLSTLEANYLKIVQTKK